MSAELAPLLGEGFPELRARALAFVRGELAPLTAEPDDSAGEARLARTTVAALARAGYLAWTVPAAWSAGRWTPAKGEAVPEAATVGVRALCLLRSLFAYESGLADLMFAMQGLGSYPIALAGSEKQRSEWLGRVAGGEAIAAIAITEPGAGSDLGAIATTARRDAASGDYILEGEKTLISNAPIASFFCLIARTGPADSGARGLSAFVIPAEHAGVDRARPLRATAPHPIGGIVLRGCRVPERWRLGAEGEGSKIALATLGRFRVTVGAAAIGLGERALDDTVARARGRVQFGRPLAEFGGVQSLLADMATDLAAARLLVAQAARALDRGERAVRASSMAKLAATETAGRVADLAVQLHGGAGVLRGTPVERIWRELRALRIYEGTSEIQKLLIARELLEER